MRFNGRRLPTHPEDLIQSFLIVQPALMKKTGMKIKGIKIMKISGFMRPQQFGTALMKQTLLQDAAIPENVNIQMANWHQSRP